MAEDKLFYVGQKAFIKKDGNVLVLKAKNGVDFPGGKIKIGEDDHKDSLKREVKEETGLEIKIGRPFITWYFEFKPGHRYAGKQVYLVGFECQYISGDIEISDEHISFDWVDENTYRKLDDGSSHFKALAEYFKLDK